MKIPLIFLCTVLSISCSSEFQLKQATNNLGTKLYTTHKHLPLQEQNFEHLWHVFDRYYAFFEEKGINWQEVYAKYRPRFSEQHSEDELLKFYGEILNPLKDGHVRLIREGKNAIQLDRRPCTFSQKFKNRYREYYENSAKILLEHGFSPLNHSYRIYDYEDYGIDYLYSYAKSDKLGYLRIADCRDLLGLYDEILGKLSNVEGLIIDMRFNLGGEVGKEMAARFLRTSKDYGYKIQKGPSGFSSPRTLRVNPDGYSFTKPVVVLQSDASFSAAEEFLLVLKGEDHISLLGISSGGYFSDVFVYRLPDDMRIWLSYQRYYNPDSILLEDRGVEADKYQAYSIEDLNAGKDPHIEKAIDLLGGIK